MMKAIRSTSIVTLLLLGAAGASVAQETRPFVRARLTPRGVVTVGQPVELQVEVFVTTWFSRAPEFATLDIENAIATPPGRSSNLNERVSGQQYFGIRRAYTIYPQVAGTYDVPALSVTVRPGGSDDVVTLSTRPLSFEARIPDEAAGLDYFIGTTRLTLSQSVEPSADTLKVGDALTRTIRMTVVEALSLVLPPLTFDTISGLAVYPEPAVVTDEGGERGTQRIGRRVESVTYVMEAEGGYELPAVEIAWWDLRARRLRRSTVPAVSFHVGPNPDYVAEFELPAEVDSLAAAPPAADSGISRQTIVLAAATLLLAATLLWLAPRLGPRLRARMVEWRRRRRESEATYFARFRAACRANEPASAMKSLLAWLDKVTAGDRAVTIAAFLAEANDPELARAVSDLEQRLFGPAGIVEPTWRGSGLYRSVQRHRNRRAVFVQGRGRAGELVVLNPQRRPST